MRANYDKRTSSTKWLAAAVLLLAALLGAMSRYASAAEQAAPTFVDRPGDAAQTFDGSNVYARQRISDDLQKAIEAQAQRDWEQFKIARESNLGLPLGSAFLQARNGKYVEVAFYERAAFTLNGGQPARQLLSSVVTSGKVQIDETEYIDLPLVAKIALPTLPVAGEVGADTVSFGTMAKLLSTDKSKAFDANASAADKWLHPDASTSPIDTTKGMEALSLGGADATTGHRIPSAIGDGLARLFGTRAMENVGLPVGPAIWVMARIGGVLKPVCAQVFERMTVTYNPSNSEQNRVQVSLGGATVYAGLLKKSTKPASVPSVATYDIWENHQPGPSTEKAPLLLDLGLQFSGPVDGYGLDSPENRLTIRRESGELVVITRPELLGISALPGAATRVEFNKPSEPSPIKLTCGEKLYSTIELRLNNSTEVFAIPLPAVELGCPV